jgi:hypothetical protein
MKQDVQVSEEESQNPDKHVEKRGMVIHSGEIYPLPLIRSCIKI